MSDTHPDCEILVVDDDPAMRLAAVTAAGAIPRARIRTAASLDDARRRLADGPVALAIIDLGLPDGSGIDLVRALTARAPAPTATPTICVVHTVFDDDDALFAALAAGAQGYLLKGEPLGVMAARLRAALAGEPAISPAIARRVLAWVRDGTRTHATAKPQAHEGTTRTGAPAVHLTPREHEVLRLIAQGATLAETAAQLGVSINTIKTQVKRIYAGLDVSTRVEAAARARRLGLLAD